MAFEYISESKCPRKRKVISHSRVLNLWPSLVSHFRMRLFPVGLSRLELTFLYQLDRKNTVWPLVIGTDANEESRACIHSLMEHTVNDPATL